MSKKMSEFDTVTEVAEEGYFPMVNEDGSPKLNEKIKGSDLALGLAKAGWIDGGSVSFEDFQAGVEVDEDPNKKEYAIMTLPQGCILDKILIVAETDLEGDGLEEQNVEVLNLNDDFIKGNLFSDWLDGESPVVVQKHNVEYTDRSGEIFLSGIVIRLRLTTNISIASLTAGSFRFLYKLEKIAVEFDS